MPELPETEPETSPSPAAASTTDSEEIDLSDFGFEDNSENLNPVLGDEKEKKEPAGPVDYEMNVDIEDDNETKPEKQKHPPRNLLTMTTFKLTFLRIQKKQFKRNRKQTFLRQMTTLTLILFLTILKTKTERL